MLVHSTTYIIRKNAFDGVEFSNRRHANDEACVKLRPRMLHALLCNLTSNTTLSKHIEDQYQLQYTCPARLSNCIVSDGSASKCLYYYYVISTNTLPGHLTCRSGRVYHPTLPHRSHMGIPAPHYQFSARINMSAFAYGPRGWFAYIN